MNSLAKNFGSILTKYTTIIFSLFIGITGQPLAAQDIPQRIEGSPHPKSGTPDTLVILQDDHFTEAQLLTIQTLQGLLAKKKPTIYRDNGKGYSIWLDDLKDNYGVAVNTSLNGDFKGLLNHFKHAFEGYILSNLHDHSANAAISLSGISDAIVVTPQYEPLMNQMGIPLLYDIRNRNEEWVFENFAESFNKNVIVYQKEEKDLYLGDYSVFAGAFHFFDEIDSNLASQAFSRMNDNGVLFGWGNGEHPTVAKASSHSIHVYPADWALNLSTLSNFNSNELRQQTHTNATEMPDSVHTVCFVMTDGDNLQWLLGGFATSQNWYGSDKRGKVNLGWTISPALSELAPTVMNYFYQNAADLSSGRDYFIAGPSGLGYIYPDQFPAVEKAAVLLNRFMDKADLNIVNIIGDNSSEQYLGPYLEQSNIDALFYYEYSNYSGLAGDIRWISDKPVIGGRYNLWEGFESPVSLAEKLNKEAKNPYSKAGYSLIPVHVWSNSVDSVIKVTDALDSQVQVVTPDEFVRRIKTNIDRR